MLKIYILLSAMAALLYILTKSLFLRFICLILIYAAFYIKVYIQSIGSGIGIFVICNQGRLQIFNFRFHKYSIFSIKNTNTETSSILLHSTHLLSIFIKNK